MTFDELPQMDGTSADDLKTFSEIVKAIIGRHEGASLEGIFAEHGDARAVALRTFAFFLCRKATNASMVEIGKYFKKHHTTVTCAMRRIEQRFRKEPEYKAKAEQWVEFFKTKPEAKNETA